MTTTLLSYLLNEQTPIDALLEYCVALKAIADANAALLQESLPDGTEVLLLTDRSATLAAAQTAWKTARRLRGEAVSRRDAAHEDALKPYAWLHKRLTLLHQSSPTKELTALLAGCPTPSVLRPADLASAMAFLADGIADHAERFARLGVRAATLETLEAKRLALAQSISVLVAVDAALCAARLRRKEARVSLLGQARLVEGCLLADLPDDAKASLKGARIRCLPGYARGGSAATTTDEVDEDDDAEDPDDIPSPAEG